MLHTFFPKHCSTALFSEATRTAELIFEVLSLEASQTVCVQPLDFPAAEVYFCSIGRALAAVCDCVGLEQKHNFKISAPILFSAYVIAVCVEVKVLFYLQLCNFNSYT